MSTLDQINSGPSPEKLREQMRDPAFLPNHKEIKHAFPREGGRDTFREFCFDEHKPVFEFLNKEFIDSFSDHLSSRARELGATTENPVVILEVGAGNGRLTHFLQQQLDTKLPGQVKVIATDSGSWDLKTDFPVESLDHADALAKYRPSIVIFSWPPNKSDCTDAFRAEESVQEYIIIGEEAGCCGSSWKTWGIPDFEEDHEGPPPYELDGFSKRRLDDVTDNQISRMDNVRTGEYRSSTVSFRRL